MFKKKLNFKSGMTYVELIVILSIFAVLSTVVLFQYNQFQAKADLKSLASEIALNIVQAQKSATNGVLPVQSPTVSPWKPAYGVYFNTAGSNQGADSKDFIYFADLNNNNTFDDGDCTGECINKITITKDDTISSIDVFYEGDSTAYPLNDLTITFTRPNEDAIIRSSTALNANISYVQINITSPQAVTNSIELYPSGRVQIN